LVEEYPGWGTFQAGEGRLKLLRIKRFAGGERKEKRGMFWKIEKITICGGIICFQ